MKRIFTLLFSITLLSTAFAQYGPKDGQDWNRDRDVHADNHHRDQDRYGSYYFTPRERDMQVAQINREYDYKIRSVKNHFFLGWYQKKRQINYLENKRNSEINAVYAKFNDRRNRFNHDRRYKNRW